MVEVGLVDVQVHHAGVGPADLGQVQIAEAAADLRGAAPVLQLRLHLGVAPFDDAGDDGVALAGPLQVGHHLAHRAAGVQLAQPGGGVGVGVVGRALFLHVDQHHRHVQVPHGGQHIVAGGVGQKLQDDQVHVRGAELVPRGHGQLFGGDDAPVDQLDRRGDGLFEGCVLPLELGDQAGELGQIGPQRNGKDAHTGFGVDQHGHSSSIFICTFRLPMAVASMGRAITRLPVARAVRSLSRAFLAPPPAMYRISQLRPVTASISRTALP